MSDLPAIAQIMASAVGLVGAMVAGLSVYLNFRGRHNPFRQAVYDRQMGAYLDISAAMSDLYTAAQDGLALVGPRHRLEEGCVRLRAALRDEHERYTAAVNRALIVLPSRVKAALDHFNDTLLALADPGEQSGVPEPAALAAAYERAINSIRHHLAVDSLTTGMLAEMGIGSESVVLRRFRSEINPLMPVARSER
jgi:hypothetical protein